MISMGDSGGSIEVATIGCEGMVGLPLLLGGGSAAGEVFVQVPGDALVMSAARFHHHMEQPAFKRVLLLYTQALLTQIAQCSACNNHHPLAGRCARWLLQTHDRVRGDEFPSRTTSWDSCSVYDGPPVTQAAQTLQERGLIPYHRAVREHHRPPGAEARLM